MHSVEELWITPAESRHEGQAEIGFETPSPPGVHDPGGPLIEELRWVASSIVGAQTGRSGDLLQQRQVEPSHWRCGEHKFAQTLAVYFLQRLVHGSARRGCVELGGQAIFCPVLRRKFLIKAPDVLQSLGVTVGAPYDLFNRLLVRTYPVPHELSYRLILETAELERDRFNTWRQGSFRFCLRRNNDQYRIRSKTRQ